MLGTWNKTNNNIINIKLNTQKLNTQKSHYELRTRPKIQKELFPTKCHQSINSYAGVKTKFNKSPKFKVKNMNFKGKVIIVTGASSSIGRDIAVNLAKLEGHLVLVGRSAYRLSETANNIDRSNGPKPLMIIADVTKDAKRIIDETIEHFGKLDVLINNAGVGKTTSIMDTNIDDYDRIMNTNMRSIFLLTQLAVPHLEKTSGNIVNVSSIAGLMPYSAQPILAVSKAALNHFTKCCAVEFGAKNIRVNSVNPGFVSNTVKTQHLIDASDSLPLGRIGNVKDISEAIAFLASDSASFVTGTLFKVDGGATLAGFH